MRIQEHRVIIPLLISALIIGLTFTFIVPPWQHYDEPSHFEYAWLIANRAQFPTRGEFDQIVRREIAASMVEHNFFDGMNIRPRLIAQGEPVWIGISQINQRFLYHLIVAAPLFLIRGADITFQLYVSRLVSLLLYIITIFTAYGIISEITHKGNPLRWLVPLTITLIPGFTDLMTAVNDDVGATVLFSLFLWLGLRTILRGLNWWRLFGLVVLSTACYWTKNTVAIAVLLVPIPVLFKFFRGKERWIAWAFLGVMSLLATMTVFAWGDAANWYRMNFPDVPARERESRTPLGKYAFHLPITPGEVPPSLIQLLPTSHTAKLKGKTVTLGAWIWASKPVKVRTPILYYGSEIVYAQVDVSEEPLYYQVSTTIPENSSQLQVRLSPIRSKIDEEFSVYYDGLLLVEGEFVEPPDFRGGRGNQLWIDDKPVESYLRNASAESSWPYVQGWADDFFRDYFPGRISLILAVSLDWSPSLWYYQATMRQLVSSFWARFGWGHVTLLGYHPYTLLGLVTVAGLSGGVFVLGKKRHILIWDLVIFFGAALVLVWSAALMRGLSSILTGPVFIPSARYVYPVIIPTVFLLTIGWHELIAFISRTMKLSMNKIYTIYSLFFAGLTILSIASIVNFYYR